MEFEEVLIDSFNEEIPISIDPYNYVASSFDEELSNLSVPSSDFGIEASDLGSLLEQFEEVSYTLDFDDVIDVISMDESVVPDIDNQENNNNNNNINIKNNINVNNSIINNNNNKINRNASPERKLLTNDFIQKIKSSIIDLKQKTAVMLPLAVPAKRGRGRAMTRGHPVALPANCTPPRLQRVMLQHRELNDGLPEVAVEIAKSSKVKKKDDTAVRDENYFELIVDHDYTRSCSASGQQQSDQSIKQEESKKDGCETSQCDNKDTKEVDNSTSISSASFVPKEDEEIDVETIEVEVEEGEVIEDEKNNPVLEQKVDNKGDRPVKTEDIVEDTHDGQFFNKLPSYCTALSIPRKSYKKTASHVAGRGGISVHDYIERDASPVRDTCGYSKLPDYHSSFTNSTKYDTFVSSGFPEESKDSSGYSSVSISPSRRSRSPTPEQSYSPSLSLSQSRHSRSRSRCRTTSRRDSERRQTSYSPYSRCSSSCSRSSCSRSSSVSSSCSSSSCCSSCDSRSSSCSSSRSPSPASPADRAWQRDSRFRAERSRPPRRSRSRSRSYSRGRSYRPYPRETYRSRSRSNSRERLEKEQYNAEKERRREDKKMEKEIEKKQQMRERRIVYVGGLPNKYTRHELRNSFSRFGDVEHVQLHFREHGDNYGFVTFAYTCDAYAAIEKGRSVAGLEKFDLCFGGRRQFCDEEYADLDGNKEVEEEYDTKNSGNCDFDELLRRAQQKLKK